MSVLSSTIHYNITFSILQHPQTSRFVDLGYDRSTEFRRATLSRAPPPFLERKTSLKNKSTCFRGPRTFKRGGVRNYVSHRVCLDNSAWGPAAVHECLRGFTFADIPIFHTICSRPLILGV